MARTQRLVDRRAAPPPKPRRKRRRTRSARIIPVVCWTIITVCVLAFAASLAVPLWFQLHDQRILLVTSGSMEPYFRAGDAVIVQRLDDPSQLRINQVVSFYPATSNQLVTHRIVGLKSLPVLDQNPETGRMEPRLDESGQPMMLEYIVTKGDANPDPDPNATPWTNVRGIVLRVEPGMGSVLGWAHSAEGRAAMLAPPLLLLALMEVVALLRERRAPKPEPKKEEVHFDDALLLE